MAGRVVTYNDRVTPVQLGDHVLTRVWFRKRKGRVVYVPGVSALNTNMEYNGLCWVGILLDDGGSSRRWWTPRARTSYLFLIGRLADWPTWGARWLLVLLATGIWLLPVPAAGRLNRGQPDDS